MKRAILAAMLIFLVACNVTTMDQVVTNTKNGIDSDPALWVNVDLQYQEKRQTQVSVPTSMGEIQNMMDTYERNRDLNKYLDQVGRIDAYVTVEVTDAVNWQNWSNAIYSGKTLSSSCTLYNFGGMPDPNGRKVIGIYTHSGEEMHQCIYQLQQDLVLEGVITPP